MAKESDYREELAYNHGKPLSFFKAPNLATRERSQLQRYRKLKNSQIADIQELERNEKAAKSSARHGRFALDTEHMELKKLIEKREAELTILMTEYNENHQAKQFIMTDQLSSLEASPESRIYEEKRLISQDGTVEEVQLDLSHVKTLKGKLPSQKLSPQKNNYASPYGSKSRSSNRFN